MFLVSQIVRQSRYRNVGWVTTWARYLIARHLATYVCVWEEGNIRRIKLYWQVRDSVCLSVCLSVRPSVFLYVGQSLSICLSISRTPPPSQEFCFWYIQDACALQILTDLGGCPCVQSFTLFILSSKQKALHQTFWKFVSTNSISNSQLKNLHNLLHEIHWHIAFSSVKLEIITFYPDYI